MELHIMPGDSLTERFNQTGIEGDIAVCRECLIEGDVKAESLDEFWNARAMFLKKAYGATERSYFDNVAAKLIKLQNLPPNVEINLWFEHELFCQVNMWFCLSLLSGIGAEVYRVAPEVATDADIWKGFGNLEPKELLQCFTERKLLSIDDIKLGRSLWTAYQAADHPELLRLSKTGSDRFPFLERICKAEIDKATRPLHILADIKKNGITEFTEIFAEFSKRAGIYGFGDSQLKRLLQEF